MTPGFSAESYYSHAGREKMKKEKELERKYFVAAKAGKSFVAGVWLHCF